MANDQPEHVKTSSTAGRPRGVMTSQYAADRGRKAHLVFRLKCRAIAAARAYERFCDSHQPFAAASCRTPGNALKSCRTRSKNDRAPVESCRTPPRVLDFGAAEGRTLREMHELLSARESIGIEFDSDLVAMAHPLPGGCQVVQGDVTEPHPAVAPESFDLVTALAVLEHLQAPQRLMEQACRALRPGGILVASCPAHLWDTISGKLGLLQDEYHEGHFDRARFEACARAAGLVPVCYERFMFAPIAFLLYLRLPFSPDLACRVDERIRALRVFNALFVNQLFVARRV